MERKYLLSSILLLVLLSCNQGNNALKKELKFEDIFSSSARIENIAKGFNFLEGPIWDTKNNRLIFSEVGNNVLHQWNESKGVRDFLRPSLYAGGNTFDENGNIISCQGGARQLAKIKSDNSIEVLTNAWNGKKFNSPNDVVVKSDGSIWFTDPDYGLLAAYGEAADQYKELEGYHIFMYDPDTKTTQSVYSQLSKPNGLVFSLDEKYLYVGNSAEGDRKLVRFRVTDKNALDNETILAKIRSETWGVDGLKMDVNGNLYAACGDGINVFTDEGDLVGILKTDFEVTNLCFGGQDNQTLFLTGHEGLYKVRTNVKGK